MASVTHLTPYAPPLLRHARRYSAPFGGRNFFSFGKTGIVINAMLFCVKNYRFFHKNIKKPMDNVRFPCYNRYISIICAHARALRVKENV